MQWRIGTMCRPGECSDCFLPPRRPSARNLFCPLTSNSPPGSYKHQQVNPGSIYKQETFQMKKLLTLALAACFAVSIAAVAQDTSKNCGSSMSMGKEANPPLKTIKGTVKQDGDKITFVNDADQKSWDVMNPETLKDHVGHHVQVSAHVYADKEQIHVMSVKMLKAAKEKG